MNSSTTTTTTPNTNNINSSPSSITGASSRPSPSSTTQACAACKYQRRKCNPDCTLAPYFPADHQRQFLNAHRLFGVSNILKIIRGLDPHSRSEAMKTIIFQSNARAHDPVGGCYRIALELERQYERDCQELALVLRQLALCRQAAAAHVQDVDHAQMPTNTIIDGANDDAIYGNELMTTTAAEQHQQQQQYYDYFYFDGNNIENDDHNNNIHNNNNNDNNNVNVTISGNSVNNNINNANEVDVEVAQSMFSLHDDEQKQEDDVKPFIDMFDVTHALAIGDEEEEEVGEITSRTADLDLAAGSYHCSIEIPEKKEAANLMEHVQEHDLKGAASLFTLTSRDSSYV